MAFTWLTGSLGAHHTPITSMSFHREQVWCEATADKQRKDIFIHIFTNVKLPLGGSGALIYPVGDWSVSTDTLHIFVLAVQESFQICAVVGLKAAARPGCAEPGLRLEAPLCPANPFLSLCMAVGIFLHTRVPFPPGARTPLLQQMTQCVYREGELIETRQNSSLSGTALHTDKIILSSHVKYS